jgi:hypothetical protein
MRTLILFAVLCLVLSCDASDRRRMLMQRNQAAVSSFSPSDITGLQNWLKADALALSNDDPVTTWTATTGGNAAQATAGRKPTFKTAVYGSLPTVRFDGTEDSMDFTIGADASQTIFVVAKRTATANATLFGLSGGANAQVFNASSGPWSYYNPTTPANAGSAQSIGVVVVRYTSSASADVRGISGAWAAFDPHDDFIGSTTLTIGNLSNGGGTPIDADICEVIIYDTPLSDADCNQVGNYLERWGLTWTDL